MEDSISTDYDYKIIFKNIFDEEVHNTNVYGESIHLKNLDHYEYTSNFILYQIWTDDEYQYGSMERAISFTEEPNYYYPTSCHVTESAIKSLETAFFLEVTGGFEQAEQFYKNAASVSEKKIYDDLLAGYLKRVRRHG